MNTIATVTEYHRPTRATVTYSLAATPAGALVIQQNLVIDGAEVASSTVATAEVAGYVTTRAFVRRFFAEAGVTAPAEDVEAIAEAAFTALYG